MSVSAGYLEYVMDQLAELPQVRHRRMFGGIGLYSAELFFGLIDDDVLYFRVDEINRADYVERDCVAFRPFRDKPEYSMSYYRVPEDVIEDMEALATWGRKAIAVAARALAEKPRKIAVHGSKGRLSKKKGSNNR